MFLSVDWDAFIKGGCDQGQEEVHFFMDTVWLTRVDHPYTLTGRERKFWTHVDTTAVTEVFVSESHLSALPLVNSKEMFLVDAHHDCWDLEPGHDPCCATWVTAWLREDQSRRMWWVSDHHHGHSRRHLDFHIQNQVRFTDFRTFYKRRPPITRVHICRSAAWSPPWFDQRFFNFVKRFPGEVKTTNLDEGKTFDPMKRRWSKSLHHTKRSVYRRNGLAITTVSASNWPLGGVCA